MSFPLCTHRVSYSLPLEPSLLLNADQFSPESVCKIFDEYFKSSLSRDTILDKVLEEHPGLLDLVLKDTYGEFERQVINKLKIQYKQSSRIFIIDALKWLRLFALSRAKNFDLKSSFFVLYRNIINQPFIQDSTDIQRLADQIGDNTPELLDFLKQQSIKTLKVAAKKFLSQNAATSKIKKNFLLLLSSVYLSSLERSDAYQLAFSLEEDDTNGILQCVNRSNTKYWKELLSMSPDTIFNKRTSDWKRISSRLSFYANSPVSQNLEPLRKDLMFHRKLSLELSALCQDLAYFTPAAGSPKSDFLFPEQFNFLVENAYASDGTTPFFPKCKTHFPQLQKQLRTCLKQFPAAKLDKALSNHIKASQNLLHSLVPSREPTQTSQFFNVFDVPIYQATATLFFRALLNLSRNECPQDLSHACCRALEKFPVDLTHPDQLELKKYEQFVYEVWSEYASKNPDLRDMDLSDLLKRHIQALSLEDFKLLSQAMHREPLQKNRHLVLLSFFSSAAGEPPRFNWLLRN